MPCGEILELPKTLDARIYGAGEGAHRHLKGVAGIDQERVGRRDQIVPVSGVDIDADLPGRVGLSRAEGDDLLLQADFQPLKRHRASLRQLQLKIIEPAAEQGAVAQFAGQFGDGRGLAGQRTVDAFPGQQHAALQSKAGAKRAQRLAQFPEIGQRGELIESGDLTGHGGGLSGGVGSGNPQNDGIKGVLCGPNHCSAPHEYAM